MSYTEGNSIFLKTTKECGGVGADSNVEVPYAVKNPILLPRGHPLTTLLVQEAHERIFHDGIRETLTEIRSKYWIPRIRSLTRQLIHQCVLCRKLEGTSFKPPPPPLLPTFRVKQDPAFTYTGVDFAGLIHVRSFDDVSQKAWICLFMCYAMLQELFTWKLLQTNLLRLS